MHLDEEKAKQGRFNGIIVSGIHTIGISFKLWVELDIYGDDVIAGTGMNNIKFIKPVYPGDELHTIAEVLDKKEKKKKLESLLYYYLLTMIKKQKYLKVICRH